MTTLFPHPWRTGIPVRRLVWITTVLGALPLQASPWIEVTTGLFNEAHSVFVAEGKTASGADRRTVRYGEAVSLLNVQPRTHANIDKAYALFEEIRSTSPDDDLGIASRYMQGRIEQVQRATPDLAKADAIFSGLGRDHPAHPVAQRARVKLALIRLYADIDAAERRRRYDEFSAGAASLTDAGAKVQMHLLLGEFARRLHYGHEQEFAHLLAADEAGVTKRRLQGELLVRIGDLARLTGRPGVARDYYTRYLEQFPRTDRRSLIEGYLAIPNASAR
ncbi:MAG TPA: hypothetical protein VIO38_17100 [Rariglobus sp.]